MRPVLTLLIATLTLAGCSEQAAPPATSAAPTQAAAPAAAPAEPTAATAASEAVTGIAECDDFLAAYQQCLNDKMPAEARPQMAVGFEQWKTSWRDLAANDATRASLPQVCQQSREASKPALQAYGCTL